MCKVCFMAKLCYMYTHCQSVWNCDGVNAYYKIVVLIIFLRCTCREHTQAYMYYFLILHEFQYCCSALRDAFVRQIKEGYSHADKQLRYVRHLWFFSFLKQQSAIYTIRHQLMSSYPDLLALWEDLSMRLHIHTDPQQVKFQLMTN